MTPHLDPRNTNSLWASVLVETLVRAGTKRAVVSPGSRSTPLTVALARHPRIETTPVLDERSAGFFALGMAKVSGIPVALVCTSGTAAANCLPAIVEAHESGVPLVVMTADRPAEMRGCGSGQTIDQQKLFGSYVNWYHEFAVPALDLPMLRYLRQTVLNAFERANAPQPGPVHLNAPFRDPLPPVPDPDAGRFAAGVDWPRFFSQIRPATAGSRGPGRLDVADPTNPRNETKPVRVPETSRGLVVVGPAQPVDADGFAAALGEAAGRLGWPVLADGLSPARHHADRIPDLVTTYDVILRSEVLAERLKPDAVLCVGGWPTSKVLRSWIEACDPMISFIGGHIENRDAIHGRSEKTGFRLEELAASIPRNRAPTDYARNWVEQEHRARSALESRMHGANDLIEPKASWLLARALPEQTPVFVANSMPIRDVEFFWPASSRGILPLCNRGANGIDGTLSSALGAAEALRRPSILLTGDLALVHDTNGFLITPRLRTSLTIVLINNRGGGIFENLPIAGFEPPFEEYFATPQRVDFAGLCSAYSVDHLLVRSWAQFESLISTLPSGGTRVLEIRTDRKRDAALRSRWFAEIAAETEPR